MYTVHVVQLLNYIGLNYTVDWVKPLLNFTSVVKRLASYHVTVRYSIDTCKMMCKAAWNKSKGPWTYRRTIDLSPCVR